LVLANIFCPSHLQINILLLFSPKEANERQEEEKRRKRDKQIEA